MPAKLYCFPFNVEMDAFKQIEPGVLPTTDSNGLSGPGRLSTPPQDPVHSVFPHKRTLMTLVPNWWNILLTVTHLLLVRLFFSYSQLNHFTFVLHVKKHNPWGWDILVESTVGCVKVYVFVFACKHQKVHYIHIFAILFDCFAVACDLLGWNDHFDNSHYQHIFVLMIIGGSSGPKKYFV